MTNTTPNKEIVRRICILHGANECFLLVKTGGDDIHVLTNIKDADISSCKQELKDWAGMDFNVFTMRSDKTLVEHIIQNGEKILPIKF